MKTFTSLMIIVLLSLCHYVDRLSPKTENSLSVEVQSENFNLIEYEHEQIDNLRLDTVYYTHKNSNETEMFKAVN